MLEQVLPGLRPFEQPFQPPLLRRSRASVTNRRSPILFFSRTSFRTAWGPLNAVAADPSRRVDSCAAAPPTTIVSANSPTSFFSRFLVYRSLPRAVTFTTCLASSSRYSYPIPRPPFFPVSCPSTRARPTAEG